MANENNAYLTELDVKSVTVILPLLIEQAKKEETITYSDLNNLAYPELKKKLKHKKLKKDSNQIIGRRVEWVGCFTNKSKPKKLPQLTALVVRDDTGKPGEGFGTGDFKKEKKCCFDCKDWREGEIDDFLAELKSMLGLKKAARERREIFRHFKAKNNR